MFSNSGEIPSVHCRKRSASPQIPQMHDENPSKASKRLRPACDRPLAACIEPKSPSLNPEQLQHRTAPHLINPPALLLHPITPPMLHLRNAFPRLCTSPSTPPNILASVSRYHHLHITIAIAIFPTQHVPVKEENKAPSQRSVTSRF